MSENTSKPYDRSYWVTPGLLLAGCYPGDKDPKVAQAKMAALIDTGIRSIVNLMEEHENSYGGVPFVPYLPTLEGLAADANVSLTFRRFPIRDNFAPTIKTAHEIVAYIDAQIEAGIPTYLHCWGGRGRTGTIVACYLLRHGRANIQNVIRVVEQLRLNDPTGGLAPETNAQREFLAEFAKTCGEQQTE